MSVSSAIFERTLPFSGRVSESSIVFRPSKSNRSTLFADLLLLKSNVTGPPLSLPGFVAGNSPATANNPFVLSCGTEL